MNPNTYPVEDRAVTCSMAYFSAKHFGTGQYYLMTIVDKNGKPFDGESSYRLNVPANAPVRLYWSATVCRAVEAVSNHCPQPVVWSEDSLRRNDR